MDKGAHQDIHCIFQPICIYSTSLALQQDLKHNLHGRTLARSSTKSSIPPKLVTLSASLLLGHSLKPPESQTPTVQSRTFMNLTGKKI